MVPAAKGLKNEVTTLQDLEQVVKTGEKVFALFYASWCPFCASFLLLRIGDSPELAQVSLQLVV